MKFIDHLIEKEKALVNEIEPLNSKLRLIRQLIREEKFSKGAEIVQERKIYINDIIKVIVENKENINTKDELIEYTKQKFPDYKNITYLISKLGTKGLIAFDGVKIIWLEK